MKKDIGIVLVSHVNEIAIGIKKLLKEVSPNVCITVAGGTDNNDIGTSYLQIRDAIRNNEAKTIFAFYDLGSAKLNLEMIIENTFDKEIILINAPLVEGAYASAVLIEVNLSKEYILKQIASLMIK